jgi:hypothetical protein
MAGFTDGFLTGFMTDQADQIGKRKSEADEYFQQQMELAHKKASSYNDQYGKKLDSATTVANQMIAIGVPKRTVMAIANQNPDDLQTFYDTVQEMQAKGVDMSNSEVYEGLIQIDGEFNPGNENVTSLLKRIYTPLTANAAADPEGWDFDPKGSIWSTMLGYNAMDRARNKLGQTEVLPGVSAQQVLSQSEDGALPHPLGSNAVTLNAPSMGDLTRDAAERNRGSKEVSVGERSTMLSNYEKQVEKELLSDTLSGIEGPEKEAEARRRAAAVTLETFPEAAGIPEITKYLGDTSTEDAPGAPAAAPTAAAEPAATQVPPQAPVASEGSVEAPESLPDGSKFVKSFPDGTLGYITSTGKKVKYTKAYVDMIMKGQKAMEGGAAAVPDWTRPLGS